MIHINQQKKSALNKQVSRSSGEGPREISGNLFTYIFLQLCVAFHQQIHTNTYFWHCFVSTYGHIPIHISFSRPSVTTHIYRPRFYLGLFCFCSSYTLLFIYLFIYSLAELSLFGTLYLKN